MKCKFFLYATITVFWRKIAVIAIHSGERCGPWVSGDKSFTAMVFFFFSVVAMATERLKC